MRAKRVRFDIAKGLDHRHMVEMGFNNLINVSWDGNFGWKTCGGYEPVPGNYAGGEAARVRTVHWFDQHAGARGWILYEVETGVSGVVELRYVAPGISGPGLMTNQALATRRMPPGPAVTTTYLDVGNWCYIISPYNKPIRFNGRASASANYGGLRQVGFDARPPAPEVLNPGNLFNGYFASDTSSINPVGTWGFKHHPSYQQGLAHSLGDETVHWLFGYAISYINDLGHESPMSAVTYVAGRNPYGTMNAGPPVVYTTEGRASVVLQSPSPPENVRAIRVYRTENLIKVNLPGGSTDGEGYDQLLSSSISVPLRFRGEYLAGAEFHLTDDWSDSSLGPEHDTTQTDGTWPESAAFAAVHQHTMFLAGMAEEPNVVRHSVPLFIEQMPDVNRLIAGPGQITALRPVRNGVVVYRRTGIDVIRGTPGNWGIETLTNEIGHVGGPVIDIPERGQLFLGEDGPYLLELPEGTVNNASWRYIGGPIRRLWNENVSKGSMVAACGVYNHWYREVWVHVPVTGKDRPSYGFVYHVDVDGWSFRDDYPISCMAAVRDHRRLIVMGVHGTGDNTGLMYHHDGVETREDGTTVTSTIRARIDLVNRRRVFGAEWQLVAHGREVTFKFRKDRDISVWYPANGRNGETLESIDAEVHRDRWGSARWDASKIFNDYARTIVAVDYDARSSGFEMLFEIAGTRMHLLGLDLFADEQQGADLPKSRQP